MPRDVSTSSPIGVRIAGVLRQQHSQTPLICTLILFHVQVAQQFDPRPALISAMRAACIAAAGKRFPGCLPFSPLRAIVRMMPAVGSDVERSLGVNGLRVPDVPDIAGNRFRHIVAFNEFALERWPQRTSCRLAKELTTMCWLRLTRPTMASCGSTKSTVGVAAFQRATGGVR